MDIKYFERRFPAVVNSLKAAKKHNSLSHAYLIFSDNSDVRKEFAYKLAEIMQCTSDGDDIPCNNCMNCQLSTKNTHPDLTVIEPISKSRKIVIGKNEDDPDTLRWFQSRFSLSALNRSAKKIGIILDADRLMPEAQNAFLKTLEEPPRNSYFILTSGRPRALLPTVISRCQILLMLVNKCEYEFKNSRNLFSLLEKLIDTSQKNIISAMEFTDEMKLMFSDLHLEAEIKLKGEKAKELEMIESADAQVKKRFNNKFEAAISAEYAGLREKFLNAIYAWFAELYQLSLGVNHDALSSGSIIRKDIIPLHNISVRQAEFYLKKAERFVSSMNWNVSEDLAILEFIINVTLKPSKI